MSGDSRHDRLRQLTLSVSFVVKMYRWEEAYVECHMDPNISRATTGNERVVVGGWIHSKRRNKLHQKLVVKLVRVRTNLVLRESLDDTLHHLLPWDIDLVIDESVDESEEEPEL